MLHPRAFMLPPDIPISMVVSIKMPNCCVIGCKTRRFSTLKGKEQVEYEELHGKISFHRFPKNIQLRKLWLDRIGVLCHNVTTYSCVCSLHFDEIDLDRTALSSVRLRENALPKILSTNATGFDHEYARKQSLQEMKKDSFITDINEGHEESLVKHCKKNLELKISSTNATGNFDHEYTRKQFLQEMKKDSFITDINKGHEPLAKHCKKNLEHSNIFEEKFEEIKVSSEEECSATTPKRVTIGISVSPMLFESTPRKNFLRTALENTKKAYRHKIKILQQKLCRKNKRIAQMHSIITALRQKNFLNAKQLSVLEDLGMFHQHSLKRQITKRKNAIRENV